MNFHFGKRTSGVCAAQTRSLKNVMPENVIAKMLTDMGIRGSQTEGQILYRAFHGTSPR